MNHIALLRTGIDVSAIALELRQHPFLWNQCNGRTTAPGTPHGGVDDIWARYAPADTDVTKDYESVWYPAAEFLPATVAAVYSIMAAAKGDRLGGVLITRIPAGGGVAPHIDRGWHAEHYQKFALQIAAHPQQAFHYNDGALVTAPGDLYWFNNQHSHWVTNDSPVERLTLIVCVKPYTSAPAPTFPL